MNADALKKHHFWILAGVGPFLVVLAVILMLVNVDGAVETVAKNTKADLDKVTGAKPPGTQAIADLEKQKGELTEKKDALWKVNYDRQRDQFPWPGRNNDLLRPMADRYKKFGEPMADPRNEFNEFKRKDVYEKAYDDVAASIAPVGFQGGGWRSVLRYVPADAWGDRKPTDKQIWLALEDYWVQKVLLQTANAVNTEVTQLAPVPGAGPATPLKKSFASRIWRLDLEVPTAGPNANKVIEARLTNLTDRLQVLGTNGTLRLKVWLSENAAPVDYEIQENFVRAGGTLELRRDFPPEKDDPKRAAAKKAGALVEVRLNPAPTSQGIPPGTDVREIVRVEAVPDERTLPVRQVMTVELGYKDARHSPAALKAHKLIPAPDAAAAAAASGAGTPGPTGMPGVTQGAMPSIGTAAGPGGPGAGAAAGRAKVGPPAVVLDGNRERYIETSDQVRRMPVALVLLVDQLFMQDALVAYANSPLRFQVTQAHWKRFHGTLTPSAPPGGGASGDEEGPPGPGGPAAPAGPPPFNGPPPGFNGPPPGSSAGGGRPSFGSNSGGGRGRPGLPPPGEGADGERGGATGFGSNPAYGGMGGAYGGALAAVPEAQVTSGLVELTIYGVVSLYEKYDDKAADPAAGGTPVPPAAAPPTPPKG